MKRSQKKKIIATGILSVILIMVCLLSVLFGAVFLTPDEIVNSLWGKFSGFCSTNVYVDIIIWQIRLPRIILSALVGMMLAISGTILQGVLRNPLADPYILGVSAGGSIGAILAMALGLEFWFLGISTVPIFAFLFAIAAVFIVYMLSNTGGKTTPQTLILAGVTVSIFASALLSIIIIITGDLQSIYFWLLGSFSGSDWGAVLAVLPYALIGFGVAYFYSKDLNALLLGEETAYTLGVDVEKVRRFLLIVASILAAATVAVAGLIGFVGLIVPHFVRLIVGPHHKLLIPLSALTGMLIVVIADTIARTIFAPIEIPVGIVMALFGCPFFLYLLRRRRTYIK
ncbi:MAG: iron ABC transporter permease [Candidatus Margulisbacteria bacterium]|nr:iron ABC transporter permease [Candidatus Margulisiibacteriota bacterium]MBU1021835.1 iron ABC transporter permease [Candidatus Margulisiibacteriota bacterium]MBU1728994.1 iron ABC transporter permease [Candidatus Margulisiibacteriota bacterium]MBU1954453.1 iron ABC transporter permease [Candidatus Margulisiibacteriota bacterium]